MMAKKTPSELGKYILKGLDWLLPDDPILTSSRAARMRARVVVVVGMASLLILYPYSQTASNTNMATFYFFILAGALTAVFGARITKSVVFTGLTSTLTFNAALWLVALSEQSAYSSVYMWLSSVIVLAYYALGTKWGLMFTASNLLGVILHHSFVPGAELLQPPRMNTEQFFTAVYFDHIFTVVMVSVLAALVEYSRHLGELDLANAQKQSFEAARMAELTQLAGGIAHEINNPLSIIRSSADQLQQCVDNDELSKELVEIVCDRLVRTSIRISKIANSLLVLTKDAKEDQLEAIRLRDLFTEILDLFSERARSQQVGFGVDTVPPEFYIYGRRVQLTQALVNLVNNAFDAVESIDEKIVEVRFQQNNSAIQIHVTDSGVGVPTDLHKKVFMPFFTTKAHSRGAGLGLSIASTVIALHSGTITLGDHEGRSVFTVSLPKVPTPANFAMDKAS